MKTTSSASVGGRGAPATIIPMAVTWFLCLGVSLRYSIAFAPPIHRSNAYFQSRREHSPTTIISTTSIKSTPAATDAKTINANQSSTSSQTETGKGEFSYASILKVMDDSHHSEVNELCPYLASETTPTIEGGSVGEDDDDLSLSGSFQSPDTPIMSHEAVKSIQNAAQSYFEGRRDPNNNGAWGIERVDLGELLSADTGWNEELNDALIKSVYPIVRSGWADHDAFSPASGGKDEGESTANDQQNLPTLTVTSADIFSGGGFSCANVALTTLERDAGLFVLHIDLGNEADDSSVMGALYLESLVEDDAIQSNNGKPIVGPLSPGQAVVHRSPERTAAIMVPSNIHSLDHGNENSLDCPSRTQILKDAERVRHYCLRLVLTTKTDASGVSQDNNDDSNTAVVAEAPSEERSYRLRSYARFSDDRVRYLTLAALLDANDYENHLWLGFDYLERTNDPNYQNDNRQCLSYVNKAVFHLETAAKLNPSDARVHFQLASVMKTKMDYETRLLMEATNGQNDDIGQHKEMAYLSKAAQAVERSYLFESAAVKLGVNEQRDLAINCNRLAELRCKMGDFRGALDIIDRWAECGSIRSKLAIENRGIISHVVPNYEWIQTPGNEEQRRNVAARTVGNVPVFEPEDVALIRSAADRRFASTAGVQTSRYSMQYEGNSEVHLDDLCVGDPALKARIDSILENKVYPLVRATFTEEAEGSDEDEDEPPLGPLCVYDSIFVRYNGDIARAAGRIGASQPLHQDGGIYSVNIALNAHEDDDTNGFTGGGTFFEALAVGDGDCIQRPIAPGHAIVHKTTQRHAGAPTISGVRDILVIFLSARRTEPELTDDKTWRIERAMRLQSMGQELERDKMIPVVRLARSNDPLNSECPYWLGVHLVQGDINDPSDERWADICEGLESLQLATEMNPADARAHYNLGMAISYRHKYAMRSRRAHLLPPAKEAADALIKAFDSAIRLEGICEQAGCSNDINLAAAYLSLGEFMARLQRYEKAIPYLNQVEETVRHSGDIDQGWAKHMMGEAASILEYCSEEIAKKNESSLV